MVNVWQAVVLLSTAGRLPVGGAAARQSGQAVQAQRAAIDPARGREIFRVCAACHNDSSEPLGPALGGVIGRKAGAVEGFRYSTAMKRAGLAWTRENLRQFLRDPQGTVKGTRMPFSGLAAERDIDDVIAFLSEQK
jgi:cytochrome c